MSGCPPVIAAQVLDSFLVRVDGRLVKEWPRPPARRLVQLLLVEPRHRVLREVAMELLAPDAPPERARRAVSKALSQARQAVGADTIVAEGPHLRLVGELHVDLDDLQEQLHAAIAMPTGEQRRVALELSLSRFAPVLPGEPDFGPLATARQHLTELAHAARIAFASEWEAVGSLAGWEAAFAAAPFDDDVASGFVSACRRMGDEARAVQVYRAASAAMTRAFGHGRSVQLETAVEGLLSATAAPATPRLQGRDRELRDLVAALRSAEDHAGAAIAITGPAGIGKSAVVEGVTSMLEGEGWRTALAVAGADDGLVPYAALRGVLAELLGVTELPRTVVPPSVKALLRPRERRAAERWPMPVLVADLGRLLDRLAGDRPLLVAIDDVHRSDPATHELVGQLTGTRPARSWSLLLAARTDEPGRPVPHFGQGVRLRALGPLDPASAFALAGDELSVARVPFERRDELAGLVAHWSTGNPLFIVELARQVATGDEISQQHMQTVPSRIVELFEQRLASCSESSRTTLPLVALAEPHADYALVSELATSLGLDRDEAGAVIDELLGAAVLTRSNAGVRLAHPLWREAALSRVNHLRLANLHARIADALDRVGGRELVSAGHRIAAFRSAPLAQYAEPAALAGLSAGHASRAVMAHDAALHLYGPALRAFEALPTRRRRALRRAAFRGWLETGHIYTDRLDLEAARTAYERSLGLAATDDERASAYSALGGIAYKHGDFSEAEAIYSRGLRTIGATSTWAHARLEADIAWTFQRRGDVERSLSGLAHAAELFESTRDLVGTASCLDLLAVALASAGRTHEALEASDRALELADHCRDLALIPTLAVHRSALLLKSGQVRAAEREARRALEASHRAGDRYVESVSHWQLAQCLDALGDLHGALECREKEEVVLVELANEVNRAWCVVHQASLHLRLGDPRRARERADEARRGAAVLGDRRLIQEIELALAAFQLGAH